MTVFFPAAERVCGNDKYLFGINCLKSTVDVAAKSVCGNDKYLFGINCLKSTVDVAAERVCSNDKYLFGIKMLDKILLYGTIDVLKVNTPYQERRRDRPYDARQPVLSKVLNPAVITER